MGFPETYVRNLTFRGTRIVSIFQYISNKMQRYTVYLSLETALRVSGRTSTHHQEHRTVSTASGTCVRCCRHSCMCYWWWVEVPPETCRAVSRDK